MMMTDFYNWLLELGVFLIVCACVWVMGGVKDE